MPELGGCPRAGPPTSAAGELGRGWRDTVGITASATESSVLSEAVVPSPEINLTRFQNEKAKKCQVSRKERVNTERCC